MNSKLNGLYFSLTFLVITIEARSTPSVEKKACVVPDLYPQNFKWQEALGICDNTKLQEPLSSYCEEMHHVYQEISSCGLGGVLTSVPKNVASDLIKKSKNISTESSSICDAFKNLNNSLYPVYIDKPGIGKQLARELFCSVFCLKKIYCEMLLRTYWIKSVLSEANSVANGQKVQPVAAAGPEMSKPNANSVANGQKVQPAAAGPEMSKPNDANLGGKEPQSPNKQPTADGHRESTKDFTSKALPPASKSDPKEHDQGIKASTEIGSSPGKIKVSVIPKTNDKHTSSTNEVINLDKSGEKTKQFSTTSGQKAIVSQPQNNETSQNTNQQAPKIKVDANGQNLNKGESTLPVEQETSRTQSKENESRGTTKPMADQNSADTGLDGKLDSLGHEGDISTENEKVSDAKEKSNDNAETNSNINAQDPPIQQRMDEELETAVGKDKYQDGSQDEAEPALVTEPIQTGEKDAGKNPSQTVGSHNEKQGDTVPDVSAFPEEEDSHFFAYFLTVVVFCIAAYLVFHNKQKIIALIVEGRHERRRRPNNGNYKRLDSKESAKGTSHVIF